MDPEADEEDRMAGCMLPSINDPKLWQVRCKKNHERKAAMALM